MKNTQPPYQESMLTGVPLISVVHLQNSIKVYAMLHLPYGYVVKEITHTHDPEATPPDSSTIMLEPGSGPRVETLLVKEVHSSSSSQTQVNVLGAHEAFQVIVNHEYGTAPTDEDGTYNRPFVYLQQHGNERAVHYTAWLPDNCEMSLSNSPNPQTLWEHSLSIGEHLGAPAAMTLFRNCIWINNEHFESLPELTVSIERNGKTKKVMVSTSDGSVGTGDKETPADS